MYDSQNNVDPNWVFMFDVVTTLTRAGMSSDESATEDEGIGMRRARLPYKKCRVKRRVWRNRELDPYMKILDRQRFHKNIFGNDPAGNRPRVRVRSSYPKESDRRAVPPYLPRNFYCNEWYNKLTLKQKEDLHAQAPVKLITFADEDEEF